MAKVKVYSIDRKEKLKIVDEFFDVIAGLKTKKEAVVFLSGFLTASEALMMARRIQIVRMLLAGVEKETIMKKLKVSHQNVDRIEHWLKGDEKKEKAIKSKVSALNSSAKAQPSSLLDRYSHHRFIKELLS
jgi:uncharacterized protein YerC